MKHQHRAPRRRLSKPNLRLNIPSVKNVLSKLLPGRQALVQMGLSLFVALGSIATILKIRAIGRNASALVTDGRRVFSPGQQVSEQAYVGLVIVLISLGVILLTALIAAALGRRRSTATAVLTVVFAVVSLGAVTFVFATYQQYKGMLPIG